MQSRSRRCNQIQIVRGSFLRGDNNNVPESHPSLLTTLKVDRTRQLFVAVEGASRDSWNLLAIDDGLAILHNGNGSSGKSDIEALPISGLARQLWQGSKEAVHSARMATGQFLRDVGFNLHLVAAPQIDTTIGFWCTVELQMQLEVFKFGNGNSFRSPSGANQGPVFDLPTACPTWITKPPAGKILAIEQCDRFAPFWGISPLQGWRSLATPLPGSSAGPSSSAHKLATNQLSLKHHVFSKTLNPLRREEFDLPFLQFGVRQWHRAIRDTHH